MDQKENLNNQVHHRDVKRGKKTLNEILQYVENFKIIYVKIFNSEIEPSILNSPCKSPGSRGRVSFSPSLFDGISLNKNISLVSCASMKDNTSEYLNLKEKEIGSFKVIIKVNKSKNQCDIFFDDITKILKMQQTKSDFLYQDAVESNYSHEQNTPLNIILSRIDQMETSAKDLKKNIEKERAN